MRIIHNLTVKYVLKVCILPMCIPEEGLQYAVSSFHKRDSLAGPYPQLWGNLSRGRAALYLSGEEEREKGGKGKSKKAPEFGMKRSLWKGAMDHEN